MTAHSVAPGRFSPALLGDRAGAARLVLRHAHTLQYDIALVGPHAEPSSHGAAEYG